MPRKNFWSARQIEPNFDSYATTKDKFGNGIDAVYGISKDEGSKGGHTKLQTILFQKDKFSKGEVEDWLKKNNFKTMVEELQEESFTTSASAIAPYPKKVGNIQRRFDPDQELINKIMKHLKG